MRSDWRERGRDFCSSLGEYRKEQEAIYSRLEVTIVIGTVEIAIRDLREHRL